MKVQLTPSDIESLIKNTQKQNLSIRLSGSNAFEIKHPFGKIECRLENFSERSVTISYHMGFFKNILFNFFGSLDVSGLVWDKKNHKIHLDPIFLLQSNNKITNLDLMIRNISLDLEGLFLDVELRDKTTFNASKS